MPDVIVPHTRFIHLLFLFSLLSTETRAQRHYVYVQAEDRKPFYVRSGADLHSSSPTGYVIIPRLADSTYNWEIGFPGSEGLFLTFTVRLNHRDHGYLLRHEAGAATLWDMNGGEELRGTVSEARKPLQNVDTRPSTGDAFTNSLALAIGDPQLTRTELVKTEERLPDVRKEDTKPVAVTTAAALDAPRTTNGGKVVPAHPVAIDSAKIARTEPAATKPEPSLVEGKSPPVEPPPSGVANTIKTGAEGQNVNSASARDTSATRVAVTSLTRDTSTSNALERVPSGEVPSPPWVGRSRQISNLTGQNGWELIYVDGPGFGKEDTVKVWIPRDEPEPFGNLSVLNDTAKSAIAEDLSAAIIKTPASSEVPRTSPVDMPEDSSQIVKADTVRSETAGKAIDAGRERTDCKSMATQKDVDGLRKKMAAMTDEDAQVALALKAFKGKCHTTAQVRDICFVFVRNEGKYKLMDAAYPHVYDPGHFMELEPLLTDPYFIHRFHALTGIQQSP